MKNVFIIVLTIISITLGAWCAVLQNKINNQSTHNPRPLQDRFVKQPLTPEASAQARQVAKAFLQSLANEDWDTAAKYWPMDAPKGRQFNDVFDNRVKGLVSGLEIVSLGTPFQKDSMVLVPYEIQFRGEGSRTNNLRVARERDGQWHFEGGF